MTILGRRQIIDLLQTRNSPSVSIYMPTQVSGREVRQNPIRLKALLSEAERTLEDVVGSRAEAERIMQPARQRTGEEAFWDLRSQGLAILIADREFHTFWLDREPAELVAVDDRFVVRPLLSCLRRRGFYYLLALSQRRVRLFRVTGAQVQPLAVEDLPQGIDEALNIADAERGAQMHSGRAEGARKQSAVFHGQGGEPDAAKDELTAYCRIIDDVVCREVETANGPLFLACVGYVGAIYLKDTRLSQVSHDIIEGNPDELDDRALVDLADQQFVRLEETQDVAALQELRDRLHRATATSDVGEIVLAAANGRIEELFVDIETSVWGLCEAPAGIVDVHDVRAEGDRELVEAAAAETLLHAGTVRCVPRKNLPTASPMAALLRYT